MFHCAASGGEPDSKNKEKEAETIVLDDLSGVLQEDLINHTLDAIELRPSHPSNSLSVCSLRCYSEINSLTKIEVSEPIKYEAGAFTITSDSQDSSVEVDNRAEKRSESLVL